MNKQYEGKGLNKDSKQQAATGGKPLNPQQQQQPESDFGNRNQQPKKPEWNKTGGQQDKSKIGGDKDKNRGNQGF